LRARQRPCGRQATPRRRRPPFAWIREPWRMPGRPSASQSQHDHRSLRADRIGQARLEDARAGEQQAAVHIEHGDAVAVERRRVTQLRSAFRPHLAPAAPRQIRCLLIELEQTERGQPDPYRHSDPEQQCRRERWEEGDPGRKTRAQHGLDARHSAANVLQRRSAPRRARASAPCRRHRRTPPRSAASRRRRRSPSARVPGGKVEGSLADRPAEGLTAEQARGDVADRPPDEVEVGVAQRAVRVRPAASASPVPCTSTITATAVATVNR